MHKPTIDMDKSTVMGRKKAMREQSYYWPLAKRDDSAVTDKALFVNCAGCCVMERPFVTHRLEGRRDYYLLYLPGQRQRYAATAAVCYDWVHFTGYAAGELVESCGLEAQRPMELGAGCEDSVHAAFLSLFEEFIRGDQLMAAALSARLNMLCLTLGRWRGMGAEYDGGRLRRSLSHIHLHYQEEITVAELAHMEGLSLSQYRSVFRRATGLAPLEYLTTLRMKRACELLRQTDLSVGEVAAAVGYSDPLYFSRLFKKRMAKMPSALREA